MFSADVCFVEETKKNGIERKIISRNENDELCVLFFFPFLREVTEKNTTTTTTKIVCLHIWWFEMKHQLGKLDKRRERERRVDEEKTRTE